MKRINKLTVLVLGVAFILSGCDAKDTTPLPGERESFIVLNQSLLPDPTIVQQSVIIANPVVNQNWSQVGGNTAHAMPPLAFADKPQKVWEVSMGYGSNDEQRLVAGIVVDQGVVYGMDSSGTVYAINAVSGESLWNQSTNPEDERAQPFGGVFLLMPVFCMLRLHLAKFWQWIPKMEKFYGDPVLCHRSDQPQRLKTGEFTS